MSTPPGDPWADDRPLGRTGPIGSRRGASAITAVAAAVVVFALAAIGGYGLAFVVSTGRAAPTPAAVVSPSPSPAPSSSATGLPTSPEPSLASPAVSPSVTAGPPASAGGTPAPTPIVHVVAPGENLTQIARRYGVTVAALAEANDIDDPDAINVGQELVIPTAPR